MNVHVPSVIKTERSYDPVTITQNLIRCPSVTPVDAGCMDYVQALLEPLGFTCHRVSIGEVTNFYARLGAGAPHLCFLGHTDVVPASAHDAWVCDPFSGDIIDDHVYGRGACDMKGAVACFIAAVYLAVKSGGMKGSVSLLLTSDEEGNAQDGIKKMIPWLRDQGEVIDFCLGGEPTNPTRLGEMAKIGRRGSLTMKLTVIGKTGHVAYPHFALNPIQPLVQFLNVLLMMPLDNGTDMFDPSHLEVTTVDVGNSVSNVIPESASATLNIRFNPVYTPETLIQLLEAKLDAVRQSCDGRFMWQPQYHCSAEAFLRHDPKFAEMATRAIQQMTGLMPKLSTTGGTSDARFMKDLCPVFEFGLLSCFAHQTNERVAISDLEQLTEIYAGIIAGGQS